MIQRAQPNLHARGVALLLTIIVSRRLFLVDATGFPGTLPSTHDYSTKPIVDIPLDSMAASNSSDEMDSSSETESDAASDTLSIDETLPKTKQTEAASATSISSEESIIDDNINASMEPPEHHHTTLPTSSQPSRPLKTLKKLQAMLDETDYMTTTPHRSMHSSEPLSKPEPNKSQTMSTLEQPDRHWYDSVTDESIDPDPFLGGNSGAEHPHPYLPPTVPGQPDTDKLWTSKDRIKYKKQQERLRRVQEERRRLELHFQGASSDDDADAESGTDDGLGYSLPNLSVYLSDAEDVTDGTSGVMDYAEVQHHQSLQRHKVNIQQQPQRQEQPPPPPFAQQQQQQQQQQQFQQQQQQQQQFQQQQQQQQQQQFQQQQQQYQKQQYPGQYAPYPPPQNPDQMQMISPQYMSYPPNQYMTYPPYGPYTPQQQQMIAAQYSGWAAQGTNMPYRQYPHFPQRPFQPQSAVLMPPASTYTHPRSMHRELDATPGNPFTDVTTLPLESQMEPAYIEMPLTFAGASINFDSLQKIFILVVTVTLLGYCSVSPRTLALADYNKKFNENLRIVSFVLIAPIVNLLLVFDGRQNDINDLITTFYQSFTIGYVLAFALEVISTTFIRIGVFAWWEPKIFKISPDIPSLVVPWVLRETGYMPRRITLFAADFLTTCVASPIIEEYVKLKILQWSVNLPRNFGWVVRTSSKSKKKRNVAEALPRNAGEQDVVNINSYVTQMLAASLGMKLCDSTRRIFMYTKASQTNKSLYSLCRGIFPIHELCGTMTALALAKRDVLGYDTPLWQMLLPAVTIHGMANFRGMKPIFKWNAATPWSEMQLSAGKGFAKFMWLVILGRALGYCIKNYYLISRQAVKRTTTYAGKHAAFSAEVAATEVLKKTKDQKNK